MFTKYNFQAVIHFAAESHVDNSISGPEAFIQTNIVGTFNLLDVARKHWMNGPNQYKAGYENARFHHVSNGHADRRGGLSRKAESVGDDHGVNRRIHRMR